MTPDERDMQARNRFVLLSLLRLSGAVMVMIGLVAISDRFESVPAWAGYMILIIGLIDFAWLPRLLARRWRTPPDA